MTVSAAAPLRAKSTGTWPTAWIASVWNGIARSAASAARSLDRLHRADLVVGPHGGDQRHLVAVAVQLLAQRLDADPAQAVDRQPGDLGALEPGEPLHGVEHGVVLGAPRR